MRKCRSFWRMDGDDRWLLLQSFLLLFLVAISLKFWGFKRTQAFLAKLHCPRDRQIIKTTRMVQLAARYCQPWANCLKKSLVLWGLLRHQGIESELRIGVKKKSGNFAAHAWVEWQGFVLNDTQDVRDRFSMFDAAIEVNK
ncbi:lasso peptide biosynthesis B2 protein [Oscillatoria sp. HE19RPO]|uniref:lasso peptide biosynthesis B2 protein n=1 Tax=Oscillatoria sp. HE19RPO TaxID=2954806 RepID=UPI0020C52352|nr:lasso peptide biosynthesis B2 protein [Oscillatoria sp. HE19RPO]